MEIQEIHEKLEKHCPSFYRINEIIPFAYPYRRVKVNATVNKSPEKSIQKVYSVLLRTIEIGYNKEEDFLKFLGLPKEDFLLRELYFLRERGLVDYASGVWMVTELGRTFIKDNTVLKVLENEDFEFIIDTLSNKAFQKKIKLSSKSQNRLLPEIEYPIRSPELLKGKAEEIADIYKNQNDGNAYLVDFDRENIRFDKKDWQDYILVEYVPVKSKVNELEPYIEVRNSDKDFSREKFLSEFLIHKYPQIVEEFSMSDRQSIASIQDKPELVRDFIKSSTSAKINFRGLTIWETQEQFVKALETVKNRILIESPWVKRATQKYLHLFEKALKKGVEIYILYGIRGNDEHHQETLDKIEKLSQVYSNFHIIHLPTHFRKKGVSLEGTHRKLVIKDNDYYVSGSFNFLSFNKRKGQKVANEESMLLSFGIKEKWEEVVLSYKLSERIRM